MNRTMNMENNNSKEEKEFIEVLRRKCKSNQYVEEEYKCGDYIFDAVLFQDNFPVGVFEIKRTQNFRKEMLIHTRYSNVIVRKYLVQVQGKDSYRVSDFDNSEKTVDLDDIFKTNQPDDVQKQENKWQLTYLYVSSIIVGISFMAASVLKLFVSSYSCCCHTNSWIILGAVGGILIIAPSILSGITAFKIGLRNGYYFEIKTRDIANNEVKTVQNSH